MRKMMIMKIVVLNSTVSRRWATLIHHTHADRHRALLREMMLFERKR